MHHPGRRSRARESSTRGANVPPPHDRILTTRPNRSSEPAHLRRRVTATALARPNAGAIGPSAAPRCAPRNAGRSNLRVPGWEASAGHVPSWPDPPDSKRPLGRLLVRGVSIPGGFRLGGRGLSAADGPGACECPIQVEGGLEIDLVGGERANIRSDRIRTKESLEESVDGPSRPAAFVPSRSIVAAALRSPSLPYGSHHTMGSWPTPNHR